MDAEDLLELGSKQLDRVLGFFARVEAKASFMFALNTALLGVLVVNVRVEDLQTPPNVGALSVALILLGWSFVQIYRCSYPNLRGGDNSLLYFSPVSKIPELDYVAKFRALTKDEFTDDALRQAWENSRILTAKYKAMKCAFIFTALALFPWALFLLLASISHGRLPGIK